MINECTNYYLFSANYKLAQKLYYLGNLKAVICEKRHINQNLVNFCNLREIPLKIVEKIEELDRFLNKKIKNSLGISYGTGLIFKQKHIDNFEYGIWNIHTGKLPENRGRHPIGWSFINNDKYFTLTIHSINEKIDQGYLIYEQNIERDINDDTNTISQKVDNLLQNDFLIKAVEKYNNGHLIKLSKGNYNKNLIGRFDCIQKNEYTSSELYSIFKSQLVYGLINIDGKKYTQCNFFNEFLEYENCEIITCKDGKKLCLKMFGGGIKMIKTAMMQPTFMPWQGYFELINNCDKFIFLDDFQFCPRSHHTRNKLFYSKENANFYSVNVKKHGNQKIKLNEVELSQDNKWKNEILKRMQNVYVKTPYFKFVYPKIEIWLLKEYPNLASLNIEGIKVLCEILNIKKEFLYSSDFTKETKSDSARTKRITELLQWSNANVYLCAFGSFNYMKEDNYDWEKYPVVFQNYIPKPYYQFQSEKFIPYLSVLDALFNIGAEKTLELIISGTEKWLSWDERDKTYPNI